MNGKNLTEGLRVNVTPSERLELEQLAEREERSIAALIRRAIRELLERERQGPTGPVGGPA